MITLVVLAHTMDRCQCHKSWEIDSGQLNQCLGWPSFIICWSVNGCSWTAANASMVMVYSNPFQDGRNVQMCSGTVQKYRYFSGINEQHLS